MTVSFYSYALVDQVFPIPPCFTTKAGSVALHKLDNGYDQLSTMGKMVGYHHSILTGEGAQLMRDEMHSVLTAEATQLANLRSMFGSPPASGGSPGQIPVGDNAFNPGDIFTDLTKYWSKNTGVIGLGAQPWNGSTRDNTKWAKFEDFFGAIYGLYPAPVVAGVGMGQTTGTVTEGNKGNSLVGSLYARRATNVWYKLFQAWSFFNWGAAQTGFNLVDINPITAPSPPNPPGPPGYYNQNRWSSAYGPANFEFTEHQLRPETGFFDHERMPLVILDDKRVLLCAAFPLTIGKVHSFFEVSVWIQQNSPDLPLKRVDPTDIWNLQLTSLVLTDGTVYQRNTNYQHPLRCRGFCGLVFRNSVKTGLETAIPLTATIYQTWGHDGGDAPYGDGGRIVYGTDITDLRVLQPSRRSDLLFNPLGLNPYDIVQTLDSTNALASHKEWFGLWVGYVESSPVTRVDDGNNFRVTNVYDLHRHFTGFRYTRYETAHHGDVVDWGDFNTNYRPSFMNWANGVSLNHVATSDRMFIPNAMFPVRGRWGYPATGTVAEGRPYGDVDLARWDTPQYAWTYPGMSMNESGTGGTSFAEAVGTLPHIGTGNPNFANSVSRTAGSTYSTSGSFSGVLFQGTKSFDRSVPVSGYSHSEAAFWVDTGSRTGFPNYPNGSSTLSGAPTEAFTLVLVNWDVICNILYSHNHTDFVGEVACSGGHEVTTVDSTTTSFTVQVVLWDLISSTVHTVLQTVTVTGANGDNTRITGVREFVLADLPNEWGILVRCAAATVQNLVINPWDPTPCASSGTERSSWSSQLGVTGNTGALYMAAILKTTAETKYLDTELTVRGNKKLDEQIVGIDVAYCTDFKPYAFPSPDFV